MEFVAFEERTLGNLIARSHLPNSFFAFIASRSDLLLILYILFLLFFLNKIMLSDGRYVPNPMLLFINTLFFVRLFIFFCFAALPVALLPLLPYFYITMH